MPEKVAFICVHVEKNDGIYLATSPDLPGLNVCGESLQDVKDDVGPMIERLYKLNTGLDVKAARAVQANDFSVSASNGENMRFWAAPVQQLAA